ncbi:MAG TPA: hypothetical protein VES20_01765 [Bryobacteraceae bacterium]|nr:hypothetical protein [Bryobacteraceae bacterium]
MLAVALLSAADSRAAIHCLTVAGLGGEADYEQRFNAQAQELEKLLKASGQGVSVHTLSGTAATKQAMRNAFEEISKSAKQDDLLVLTIIGHGTFDGTDYKFNLHGPDVSSSELAAMLDRVPAQRQLVVNGTSASGASIHALQRPTRTVVAATKSGTQKNATVFPRYWIEALRDAASDSDKNETITALEAFRYAEAKTKQFYESNKRIATEQPILEGPDPGRFALLRIGSAQLASNDPSKRALMQKREELEVQIDALKLQKAAMPINDYKRQLQALLLDLARTQAELDK